MKFCLPSSIWASTLGGIALAQAMSATMVNVRYMVDDVDLVMSAAWQVLTTYGLIPPTAGGPYEDAMGDDLRCCAAADRLRRGAGAGPTIRPRTASDAGTANGAGAPATIGAAGARGSARTARRTTTEGTRGATSCTKGTGETVLLMTVGEILADALMGVCWSKLDHVGPEGRGVTDKMKWA